MEVGEENLERLTDVSWSMNGGRISAGKRGCSKPVEELMAVLWEMPEKCARGRAVSLAHQELPMGWSRRIPQVNTSLYNRNNWSTTSFSLLKEMICRKNTSASAWYSYFMTTATAIA